MKKVISSSDPFKEKGGYRSAVDEQQDDAPGT
jgi:hypothetical protein